MLCCAETKVPTMKDINRYVTNKYAVDWKNIGIELDLHPDALRTIRGSDDVCFQAMIDKWLLLARDKATWKAIEVAITNVERQKLGLDPVDDVYGMKNTYIYAYRITRKFRVLKILRLSNTVAISIKLT